MAKLVIKGLEDLEVKAGEFASLIGENRVIAFYGSMGAGKTTFITALCRHYGVEDVVNSPTFTIVNEYVTADGEPIYHFDFYRINRLAEAIDLGWEEYLYSDGLLLIEWPENIEEILPEETLRVKITINDDGSREFDF